MIRSIERHKAFIEEIQSGIKKYEANTVTCCDTSINSEHDEFMTELERKFIELFGTDAK